MPVPPDQVDYETWRLSASKLVDDKDVKVKDKMQKIQDSLMKPALKQVEEALKGDSAKAVLTLLDQVYGAVLEPHLLLKHFYADEQGDEKASEFLSRLYLLLQQLQQVGAVSKDIGPSMLVQQFTGGCTDVTLLLKLRLEEKSPPPEYGELLSAIRLEEARKTRRALTKKLARTSMVEAEVDEVRKLRQEVADLKSKAPAAPQPRNLEHEVEQLRQEIAMLRQQGVAVPATPPQLINPHPQLQHRPAPTAPGGSAHGPYDSSARHQQRRFCFKCGMFNHVVNKCRNSANPTLVMERWAEKDQQKQLNH